MEEFSSFFQYLQFEKRYSAHTLKAYRTDLSQFAAFLKATYDPAHLLDASHQHIRSWMISLVESRTDPRSINRKLSALKSYFKFELRRGTLRKSPMVKVVAPKVKKRLPSFLNPAQMDRLWAHYDFGTGFTGIRNQCILEMFYGTGMRVSELCALKDHSLDLRKLTLRVFGKGNKERILPVSKSLAGCLRDYLAARDQAFGAAGLPALFTDAKCKPLNPRTVYQIVRNVLSTVTTADQKGPHVLRHTFATHLLNNGAEISAIKELLGHASLAATQVYTHNTIDKLKDIHKKAHPKA